MGGIGSSAMTYQYVLVTVGFAKISGDVTGPSPGSLSRA